MPVGLSATKTRTHEIGRSDIPLLFQSWLTPFKSGWLHLCAAPLEKPIPIEISGENPTYHGYK